MAEENTIVKSNGSGGATRSSEEIQADIEATRARMGMTIDTLQERLDPQRVKSQAQDAVRDATIGRAETFVDEAGYQVRQMRTSIIDRIKQNPVPAALVGIGLGWLYMSGSNGQQRDRQDRYYDRSYRRYDDQNRYVRGYEQRYYNVEGSYGDERQESGASGTLRQVQGKAGEVADQAREKVGSVSEQAHDRVSSVTDQARDTVENVTEQAREKAGALSEETRERVSTLTDQAQERAVQAKSQFATMLEENPLAVGAVAFAVGTAIGLALPSTQQEDQLMGETRDRLMSQAQTVAQDTAQRVQQVAQDSLQAAKETAKQEASAQGLDKPQQVVKSATQQSGGMSGQQQGSRPMGENKPAGQPGGTMGSQQQNKPAAQPTSTGDTNPGGQNRSAGEDLPKRSV